MSSTEWISRREAARRLGIWPGAVPRVAEANGIRQYTLNGARVRYSAADIARVVASSIVGNAGGREAGAVAS